MHQMFKLTSYRSLEGFFSAIKLYNRFCLVCDGFFPPSLSKCPDTVGYETDDRSILPANVFQCSPGGFPVFQEFLFMTERGLLLNLVMFRKEIFKAFVE